LGKPFSDYELICEIQVKNGLDLGENYRNINGCKNFAASIAQTLVDVRFSLSYFRSLFLGVSGSVGSSSAFRFSACLTVKLKLSNDSMIGRNEREYFKTRG
jgi:hypothetical protein